MNVISYYEPIISTNSTGDPLEFSKQSKLLLGKWTSCWRFHGWNPIILNEEHARVNPYYKKINFKNFKSALYQKSSKLDQEYYEQCYMRWLAYSNFVAENGPTVWCDYDVYNNTLTTEKFSSLFSSGEPVLYSSCAAGGLMTPEISRIILSTFVEISNVFDVEQANLPKPLIQILSEETKKGTLLGLNDMKIVRAVFLYKNKKTVQIMSNLLRGEKENAKSFSSYLREYDLLHLHGGTRTPKNKSRLVVDMPDRCSRSEQWDHLESEIKKNKN